MKILQIIPFFVPAWGFGGPVKVCLDLSSKLVEKGYHVTVVTTDANDNSKRVEKLSEVINGVKIVRFRNIMPRLTKGYNIYSPIGFRKYIKNNISKFNLVHLHAFFTYQNIIATQYCVRNKVPYILHLHESPIPKRVLGKVLIKKLFLFLFGKKILHKAEKIIVLTINERKDLLSYYPELRDKIVIIPNSISIGHHKLPKKNFLKNKYNYKKTDRLILSLSRLSSIKGVDLLIQAFARLLKRNKNYRLVIAGPDESNQLSILSSLIKELGIQKRVDLVGLLEGKKKQEYYAMADIYALFSRYESFGITVLEALSADLPVCLSKEVGVASDVLETECGLLVEDTGNAQKSSKRLEETYQKRKVFSLNCRRALEKFSDKKVFRLVVKLYWEIL